MDKLTILTAESRQEIEGELILDFWLELTKDTISELQSWLTSLTDWKEGIDRESFPDAHSRLVQAGLEGWADRKELDQLARVLSDG